MIWGYSEVDEVLRSVPQIQNGVIVDTNILVSATYDLDEYHDESKEFLKTLLYWSIKLFCNVNIRSEFLEIHRRILFSEALLDFESAVDKAALPPKLAGLLTSYRARYERRFKTEKAPKSLSDSEIKEFKFEMTHVHPDRDLWRDFCHEQIGSRLADAWTEVKETFGLNFLGSKDTEQDLHFKERPKWRNVVKLISEEGLSCSDAMILNMFQASRFSAIASSDADIGLYIRQSGDRNKVCILPDRRKALLG